MTHDDPKKAELGVLVAAMVEGVLSATQRDRLVELLRDYDEAKRFYQRYLELHAMLEWEAGAAASQSEPADSLDDLLLVEHSAEAFNPFEPAIDLQQARATDPNRVTRHDMLAAGSYLLRHTLTPKVIASLVTAAAVLLGMVLTVVLISGTEDDATIVEDPGQTPAPIVVERPIEAPQAVATLTAEHDAVWDRRPGQDLYAGQRFTLAQGFAEITTLRGAVAILEAPATIELTHSPNAIRLHAGKLVGVCETDTSIGFLVRTPHTDVIDLGTRFGVLVDIEQGTLAEVFEGEVSVGKVGHAGQGQSSTSLTAGQSIALDRLGNRVPPDQVAVNPFGGLSQALAGINEVSGQALLLASPQPYIESEDWPKGLLCVFEDRLSPLNLQDDVTVTIQRPGHYNFDLFEQESNWSGVVPAQTLVRSYVVLLGPSHDRDNLRHKASIRFDGEVLGVIGNPRDHDSLQEALGPRSVGLFTPKAVSFWPDGGLEADIVTLSDDRQGLDLDFRTGSRGYDMIRVLVQAKQP
ncbi:MAG: hypothetical protein AAGB26_04885 [Planctomycetota bacterium]